MSSISLSVANARSRTTRRATLRSRRPRCRPRPRPAPTGRFPRRPCRLAADDEDAVDTSTEPGEHAEHDGGRHAVRLDRRRVRRQCRPSGSSNGTVPGASPMRHRVDEHERVVAVEQLVGEVHAADPEVVDPDARRGPGAPASRWATSTPKPSSPRKMLPMPATSTRRLTVRLATAAARPRRGGRRGSGPAASSASVAGSSSTVTATCSSPSTSWNTPATVAAMPARNMSCASARRDGRSRTHVPVPTSTPSISTVSVHGSTAASTAGSHHGSGGSSAAGSPRSGGDRARRIVPCRRAHTLRRHVVAAIDDRGGARVGAARLGLLLVGQREHAQREDLVDLGRVVEVAVALRARPPGGRRG